LNCWECRHRGRVPGSAHSTCNHPDAKPEGDTDPVAGLMAIFASAGRLAPMVGTGIEALEIKLNLHGVANGWANWPWDFDPIWVQNCNGFGER